MDPRRAQGIRQCHLQPTLGRERTGEKRQDRSRGGGKLRAPQEGFPAHTGPSRLSRGPASAPSQEDNSRYPFLLHRHQLQSPEKPVCAPHTRGAGPLLSWSHHAWPWGTLGGFQGSPHCTQRWIPPSLSPWIGCVRGQRTGLALARTR